MKRDVRSQEQGEEHGTPMLRRFNVDGPIHGLRTNRVLAYADERT